MIKYNMPLGEVMNQVAIFTYLFQKPIWLGTFSVMLNSTHIIKIPLKLPAYLNYTNLLIISKYRKDY